MDLLLYHLQFLSSVFIFFLCLVFVFSFYPPHYNPKTDLPFLTVCAQSQTPFNSASVISRNPDIIGSMDARTTLSLRGTKVWGDRSRFHPGCQIEASELICREFLEEIGDGSIHLPLIGSKFLTIDDGGISMRIDGYQFGLGLFVFNVVYRLPCLGPLYWLTFVPLVGGYLLYPLWAGLVAYV